MRSPVAWLSACSFAVALAGCGGEESRQEPPPTLPAALAERLATGAEAVAARLEAGDPCSAAAAAGALTDDALGAVQTPAVPAGLKEPVLSSAQELQARAESECAAAQPPPAPPPPAAGAEEDEDDGEGRGKKKGNGKGKGRGRGGGGDD